jgi:hypothetical protein
MEVKIIRRMMLSNIIPGGNVWGKSKQPKMMSKHFCQAKLSHNPITIIHIDDELENIILGLTIEAKW